MLMPIVSMNNMSMNESGAASCCWRYVLGVHEQYPEILHGGIALVPGESFEAPGFCRLSDAGSAADIESGMDPLQAFVGRLRPALERAV